MTTALLCHTRCSRVGLVSLSYLWRRNQEQLLREMIDNGIQAIVIKVASMGEGIQYSKSAITLTSFTNVLIRIVSRQASWADN